jgi:hypothetical protein
MFRSPLVGFIFKEHGILFRSTYRISRDNPILLRKGDLGKRNIKKDRRTYIYK